ncbi:MAG: pantoate--beta-alanine ligase [Gammaproteobacteria bacterium]|nr:pantoate--beta-alanine ligase [Gammaproteobacteria bacterium]
MKTISDSKQLRAQIRAWRLAGETIAFVPTMGNLHLGHLTLVDEAKKRASKVVVSIFVNPMQFDNKNDLSNYPRTLQEDQDKLIDRQTDLLFTPTPALIYPKGLDAQTYVEVPGISDILCGASRPGHFRGVATIVAKLFNLVTPDVACFGTKDYQQLQVIKNMVTDLSIGTEIVGVPTVRETTGLAKSSRNNYLTEQEMSVAPLLFETMQQLALAITDGESIVEQIALATDKLNASPFITDYIKVRYANDLSKVTAADQNLVILAAAYLGKARLIDNMVFNPNV